MFTPSRYIRNCFLMITLATLAGCVEEGSLLAPDAPASFARGSRGRAPVVEDFDVWDETAWIATDHALGRGVFDPLNVRHDETVGDTDDGALILTLPYGDLFLNGAEIRSAKRVAFRNVEIRLRTPQNAPGSLSAFFLYQLVGTLNDRNDEIDIEILNGTDPQRIIFSTYVRGNPTATNQVELTLGFDPSDGFHTYRIEWSPGRVRFLVDDKTPITDEGPDLKDFTTGVPRHAMYVMSSTWWPSWLPPECEGDPDCKPDELENDEVHIIDRITY